MGKIQEAYKEHCKTGETKTIDVSGIKIRYSQIGKDIHSIEASAELPFREALSFFYSVDNSSKNKSTRFWIKEHNFLAEKMQKTLGLQLETEGDRNRPAWFIATRKTFQELLKTGMQVPGIYRGSPLEIRNRYQFIEASLRIAKKENTHELTSREEGTKKDMELHAETLETAIAEWETQKARMQAKDAAQLIEL